MTLHRMAWRNLWRNPRRSLVTTAAMTLALWVMVLYSGMIEGYWRGMEAGIVDFEVGDVQVHAPRYVDNPSIHAKIPDPGAVLARLDAEGLPATARLLAGGLAAAGDQSAGVSLRGIDVARDARVLRIDTAIASGAWLDPADPGGVVVGARLAHALSLSLGSQLVLVSQAADGSLANDLYHVRGVLKIVADATDRTAVFMTEGAFRTLMVVPTGAHELIVRRPSGRSLDTVAAQVKSAAAGLSVRTWKQLMPTVAGMLEQTRSMVFIIFFVVYVAVAILVLNTMLMAVFERIRELGVWKALGASPMLVLGLILLECALQTAVAVVVGLTAALPVMVYLSRVGIDVGALGGMAVMGHAMPPIWYGVYSASSVTGPVIMLVTMVLLGVSVPAVKAALIQPVSAMRHV